MKERTVDVGNTELSVAEAGVGGEPLLLLHGFTGAKEDFTDWIDDFARRGFHAVAPDHRGHGASAHPADEAAYSLDILAGDVLGLADALQWDRFALLGHSMGGMIAQVVTLLAPGRVERLVLMDTHHGPVEGIDRELAEVAIGVARTDGIDRLADLLAAVQSPLGTPADQRLRAERPGYAEFGDRKMRASSPHMYAAMAIEMFEQADRLDRLAQVTVPVLVVVGDQDEPFLPASHRMAEAIPGAALAVIDDAGHSPQFEAPEAWWDAVTGFLSPHASASKAGFSSGPGPTSGARLHSRQAEQLG